MRSKRVSFGRTALLAIFTMTVLAGTRAAAQKETVLYSFHNKGKDGHSPQASLIFDAAANLYGTTSTGGAYNGGTVFELSPQAGGGWTRKILHQFKANGIGGSSPYGSLIFDAAGNLYGTTVYGGAGNSGTVFELTPTAGGNWKENRLHSFGSFISDGVFPFSSLVFDVAGNLYGTTAEGGGGSGGCGGQGCGTVFELTPTAGGGWKEKILHRFKLNGVDGINPIGGLIFDGAGNLYGTTGQGGDLQCTGDGGQVGCGAVFELAPNADGTWTETLIHTFHGLDGDSPYANLVFDNAGNLYGTLFGGGANGVGAVFELTPQAGASWWAEQIVHAFGAHPTDGIAPYAGLILDGAGNLYGTTIQGGSSQYGNGTVFELTPASGGGWSETVLHNFNGKDGSEPWAGLVLDATGNLYGTTAYGGPNGGGTVFKIAD
jgi:uncharacterized repeat protein (TIGR03803 family)